MLFLIDEDNATKYGEDIFQFEKDFQISIVQLSKRKSNQKMCQELKKTFYILLHTHFEDLFPLSTPPAITPQASASSNSIVKNSTSQNDNVEEESNTMNLPIRKRGRVSNSTTEEIIPTNSEKEEKVSLSKNKSSSNHTKEQQNIEPIEPVIANPITSSEKSTLKTILQEICKHELVDPFLYPVDQK